MDGLRNEVAQVDLQDHVVRFLSYIFFKSLRWENDFKSVQDLQNPNLLLESNILPSYAEVHSCLY